MTTKKIVIASDHGGLRLKGHLVEYLTKLDVKVTDLGPNDVSKSCDYPKFAEKVSSVVVSENDVYGILVCGTGIGMDMAANKHRGIRAANCVNTTMARLSREHNNANILCLGERIIGEVLASDIVDVFINTKFDTESGRHTRRVEMIGHIPRIEENNNKKGNNTTQHVKDGRTSRSRKPSRTGTKR